MNPDGTRSPQSKTPASSVQPEIIDVQIVEGISADIAPSSEVESLADVWDSEDEISTFEPTEPILQPLPNLSTLKNPTESTSEPLPMPNLTDLQLETYDVANSAEDEALSTAADNWAMLLDEIDREPDMLGEPTNIDPEIGKTTTVPTAANNQSESLVREESQLKADIENLRETQAQLQKQIAETQISLGQIAQNAIADLEHRRQKLQISVEQLERRRDRIQVEINKSFAGSSQEIAIRLQGFKDYLVGSLQDLVAIAEEIEFPTPPPAQIRLETPLAKPAPTSTASSPKIPAPQFIEPPFKANAQRVRELLHQYRTAPDYYATPWQLRRTFEPIHMEKVANWFLTQGGRGAVRSLNSRLQNILIASATISVLRDLYGDYLRTLVLANLPERLGDWRRGLQDCLGISKSDFGGNGGIILFEDPEALANKADRIIADKEMPLIIIDDSEGLISLSLLEYPLWLAFSPDPQQQVEDYRDYR